jgi:hypothetical protein
LARSSSAREAAAEISATTVEYAAGASLPPEVDVEVPPPVGFGFGGTLHCAVEHWLWELVGSAVVAVPEA